MVSPETLVRNQLSVVYDLDPTLDSVIATQVTAEIARQGWLLSDVTDQRAAYIADWTTYALLPRIILKFSQELEAAKGGPAEVRYQNAIEGLRLLMQQLRDRINSTARKVDDLGETEINPVRWPGAGIVGF